jgi:hypothetical protein
MGLAGFAVEGDVAIERAAESEQDVDTSATRATSPVAMKDRRSVWLGNEGKCAREMAVNMAVR